jgi:hypothetical protein
VSRESHTTPGSDRTLNGLAHVGGPEPDVLAARPNATLSLASVLRGSQATRTGDSSCFRQCSTPSTRW